MDPLVAARNAWLEWNPDERAGAGPQVMAICKAAVHELVSRLVDMGLPVAAPIVPCPYVDADIAQLEVVGPPVPPALRALSPALRRARLAGTRPVRELPDRVTIVAERTDT